MRFEDFLRDARTSVTIVGTNSLIPHLEQSAQLFADLLTLNKTLRIQVLCESDNENFAQSLCTDSPDSERRVSFAQLSVHRDRIIGTGKKDGLVEEVRQILAGQEHESDVLDRITIRQVNLRLPINLLVVDGTVHCAIVTTHATTTEDYFSVDQIPTVKADLLEFVDFLTNPAKGARFLSVPREELIQLYDHASIPRGIFPRACFYTTEFSRYSVWGFVFNRRGQLLLHQRSMSTKDGRGLWDKSIGGHVDLLDSSTSITAERELIEEMFLPQAEYTKYLRADMGDIVHFGEWNPQKRPERVFRGAFAGLSESDWVMFRATERTGDPLTITRISDRRLHGDGDSVTVKRTIFRSDVYLFIAPPGYMDDEKQAKALLGHAEHSGAALAHKLVTVNDLRDWIASAEASETDRSTFTDDLLFINLQHRELLEGFAEFVRFVSRG